MPLLFRPLLILAAMTFAMPAWCWDPHGHALVGSVADQLLSENARRQVRDILGFTLQSAAKWPDCVRSVERKPDGSFQYNRNTPYQAPCDDFMAPVAFDPVRKSSAGAFQVKWQSIPTAIGYFATAVGQGAARVHGIVSTWPIETRTERRYNGSLHCGHSSTASIPNAAAFRKSAPRFS